MDTLKLLTVGNSFSDDAMEYVWQIASALGFKKIELGNLYIGGCSLRRIGKTPFQARRFTNFARIRTAFGGRKTKALSTA